MTIKHHTHTQIHTHKHTYTHTHTRRIILVTESIQTHKPSPPSPPSRVAVTDVHAPRAHSKGLHIFLGCYTMTVQTIATLTSETNPSLSHLLNVMRREGTGEREPPPPPLLFHPP